MFNSGEYPTDYIAIMRDPMGWLGRNWLPVVGIAGGGYLLYRFLRK